MSPTEHIGYGRFHLGLLRPGEVFARFDGTLAKVDSHDPIRGDRLAVWIDYGTSNARKMLLHRTALVHAISTEQARVLESRAAKEGHRA